MTKSSRRWRFVSPVVTVAALAVAAPMMLSNTTAAQGQGAQPGAAAGQGGRGAQGGAPAGQGRGGRGGARGGPQDGPSDKDTRAYDKHDFTGVWSHNARPEDPCWECGEQYVAWDGTMPSWDTAGNIVRIPGYGYYGDTPPLTPAGMKKLLTTRIGRGFEPNSDGAKTPGLPAAYKRAGLPGLGNDPESFCVGMGLARSIVMSGPDSIMEIWASKDGERFTMRTEWWWENYDFWLDGRALPKPGEQTPRFPGYSTARWEGDTLVVVSTGFDERQWVDMFGFPISENAVLTGRWSRPSPNRLQVGLTLDDPVNYTRPWKSSLKTWALWPKESTKINGWAGLQDNRCIASDEDLFHELAEGHAAGTHVGGKAVAPKPAAGVKK